MRTNQPVRVSFDRPVDQASVAARFALEPAADGEIVWESERVLRFEHAALAPSLEYRVVLEGGYRDATGRVNGLRHSWSFRTEAPPSFSGASPGSGDTGVDPATYLSLSFNRDMDVATLPDAVSLNPAVPFALRPDPADGRRVLIAPQALLEPNQTYSLTVAREARDVDGNQLRAGFTLSFSTGPARPLRHLVGFVVDAPNEDTQGLWVVDENRFPRRLVAARVDAFSWSPDGLRLLMHVRDGRWLDQSVAGEVAQLPIQARWAGYLAPGRGWAYLNDSGLHVLNPAGQVFDVASTASEAAVAPGGTRIAFAAAGPQGTSELRVYDVDLRSQYRLQTETTELDGLAWSPDGQAVAYRSSGTDALRRQVKVRMLRGSGAAVAVATGDLSAPAWLADSRQLLLAARVASPAGVISKAFRLAVSEGGPRQLSVRAGLPPGNVQVGLAQPSPDGHQIAFISEAPGPPAVYLMNADGTGLTRLTGSEREPYPYSVRGMAWTPA